MIRVIPTDEDNRVACCYEELLRLAAADTRTSSGGRGARQPLAEIAIYRDVSKAVIPCGTGNPPH